MPTWLHVMDGFFCFSSSKHSLIFHKALPLLVSDSKLVKQRNELNNDVKFSFKNRQHITLSQQQSFVFFWLWMPSYFKNNSRKWRLTYISFAAGVSQKDSSIHKPRYMQQNHRNKTKKQCSEVDINRTFQFSLRSFANCTDLKKVLSWMWKTTRRYSLIWAK